ncbi:hypothetical protein CBL_02389 [Carabus blaptoides fortunei]
MIMLLAICPYSSSQSMLIYYSIDIEPKSQTNSVQVRCSVYVQIRLHCQRFKFTSLTLRALQSNHVPLAEIGKNIDLDQLLSTRLIEQRMFTGFATPWPTYFNNFTCCIMYIEEHELVSNSKSEDVFHATLRGRIPNNTTLLTVNFIPTRCSINNSVTLSFIQFTSGHNILVLYEVYCGYRSRAILLKYDNTSEYLDLDSNNFKEIVRVKIGMNVILYSGSNVCISICRHWLEYPFKNNRQILLCMCENPTDSVVNRIVTSQGKLVIHDDQYRALQSMNAVTIFTRSATSTTWQEPNKMSE